MVEVSSKTLDKVKSEESIQELLYRVSLENVALIYFQQEIRGLVGPGLGHFGRASGSQIF